MISIYFIQSGPEGPIKIGVANDPDMRLALMQVGNPEKLYLRAVIENAHHSEERALHDRFNGGRIRGEWFAPDTPGLQEAIQDAAHAEFWPENDDEPRCERCRGRLPLPVGRRKYCKACGGR